MSSAQNSLDFDLDLDAQRAARREGMEQVPSLTIGGTRYELPIGLPVDVLAPLTDLDIDVSMLVRMALDANKDAKASGEPAGLAVMDSIVNMVIANPKLPMEMVEAVKTGARRLLGDDCYDALVAFRPDLGDLGVIAKHLSRQYGVGLGEASPSSDSSEDTGTTSKRTSRRATPAKTSGRSGSRRRTPAS